jgi:hypothetical protein
LVDESRFPNMPAGILSIAPRATSDAATNGTALTIRWLDH